METTRIAYAIVLTWFFVTYSSGAVGNSQPGDADALSQLNASMNKMHMAMASIVQSGNTDADFVRLMIPHHQGAIDMAKVQLLHGKDPQMCRLAQEIITDQQLEIELMQRWLKAHVPAESKGNGKAAATDKKRD
jgi:uncharacterized protein (DUF305 family)